MVMNYIWLLQLGTIGEYFTRGGPVMWPLLLCSLAALVVIIERGWVLHRVRDNIAEVVSAIRQGLQVGGIEGAAQACDEIEGPLAITLKAGLLQYGKPREEIERTMEAVAAQELAKIERFLWILASVANIAPLIGFFGTVIGMISAFDKVVEVGLGQPKAVAGGISVALITTAAGLIVAFPSQLAYNYFNTRVDRISLNIETAGAMLLENLAEINLEQPQQQPQQAGGDEHFEAVTV